MKKFIYSFLFMTAILATSCEDFVDVEQPGRLGADQAFQSASDLRLGLLGAYAEFDYTPAIQFNSVFTDQIKIGVDNGGQGLDGSFSDFQLTAASAAPSSMWLNGYDALNATTRVIEAGKELEEGVPEEDQELFNQAMGESYALRAWAHFHMLTYFSPDLTNDASQGIIILQSIPATDAELPRNTTGEVFAAINEDLQEAESLIAEQSNPTFVSRDFITALRARIAAYRGNYTEADGLAASLLENYSIANQEEYREIFTDEGNKGVIFKLERTIGDRYDGQGSTGSAFAGGWAGANFAFAQPGTGYFEMSASLLDALNPNDVRYSVLLNPNANIEENTLPIGKYRGSEGQPLMHDLKIFRAADMHLLRAEAAADAGDFAAVANYLKELHDARFGEDTEAPTISNEADAFRAIVEERRIEFAYEGFRWVDLKRLGSRAGISNIQRFPSDCNVGACSFPLSDIRMKGFPIPIVELNANDVIQQTEGY